MVRQGGLGFSKVGTILMLLVVAVPIIMTATIFTNHALKSHSRDVPAINNCFDGNGALQGPFTNDHGRWAELCEDWDGNYAYWRIFVCSGEDQLVITQFKQLANRVANYILNHDMIPVDEVAC
jgi:hypothetical protein